MSVAGSEVEASGVTVVGNEVKLTLASAVEQTDEVKLGYSVPANAEAPRIQDPAGNAAPSFSQMEVTNTTPESSNTPATGAPAISGTVQVGETLTANTSGIADSDGLSNVQYEYQWLADDSDISGATNATYTLVAADEAKAITVQVSFTDDAGNEETLTSAATDAVSAAPTPNSPATGAPAISGTVQVGETLTANTSGIADSDGLRTSSTSTSGWQTTSTSQALPA